MQSGELQKQAQQIKMLNRISKICLLITLLFEERKYKKKLMRSLDAVTWKYKTKCRMR